MRNTAGLLARRRVGERDQLCEYMLLTVLLVAENSLWELARELRRLPLSEYGSSLGSVVQSV